jgi:hypothetical protein
VEREGTVLVRQRLLEGKAKTRDLLVDFEPLLVESFPSQSNGAGCCSWRMLSMRGNTRCSQQYITVDTSVSGNYSSPKQEGAVMRGDALGKFYESLPRLRYAMRGFRSANRSTATVERAKQLNSLLLLHLVGVVGTLPRDREKRSREGRVLGGQQ